MSTKHQQQTGRGVGDHLASSRAKAALGRASSKAQAAEDKELRGYEEGMTKRTTALPSWLNGDRSALPLKPPGKGAP